MASKCTILLKNRATSPGDSLSRKGASCCFCVFTSEKLMAVDTSVGTSRPTASKTTSESVYVLPVSPDLVRTTEVSSNTSVTEVSSTCFPFSFLAQ